MLLMASSALATSVSPALIDLEGARSEVLQSTFTLINSDDQEQTYYFSTIKFVPREESGKPEFISPDVDKSGLPEWIEFISQSVRVPAHSQGQVPFEVAIPADVQSGGHYAAIVVSDAPSDVVASNGASIQAKTAILLFLTVKGETVESLEVLDVLFDQEGEIVSQISSVVAVRMQNQGNVHVTPEIQFEVTDAFGRTVESVDGNESMGRILPGSSREFSARLGAGGKTGFFSVAVDGLASFAIGPMTMETTVSYGETTYSETATFWLVPWQLLFIIFVAVGSLLGVVKMLKRKKNER